MTAQGIGGYCLAAVLNKDGVPPLERRPYWTQRLLLNRAVLGEIQPQKKQEGKIVNDGDPVQGYFPAILTEDEWYAAQRQISANRIGGRKAGRTGNNFLFQNLAFDVDTGSTLVVRSTKSGGRYIRYWIPSAGLRGASRITCPLEPFERELVQGLQELRVEDITPPQGQIGRDIADALAHLNTLTARIAETTAAMAGQPPELMSDIVQQVAAWRREEKDWSRHLEELKIKASRDPLTEFKAVAMTEDRGRLRAAIRSLIKRVLVKIVPGQDRLHKRVGALVQFHACAETRVFLFDVPGDGCSVVLSGWTAEQLAAM
jgi:hypothetical protein